MDARKPRERLLGPALRTQPDRRLVALARAGSERAREEIVRRYRAALVRYAGSIVGVAAAEDVVQESLARAISALGRGDQELRLRPWLYTIVRNAALNHLRDAAPATEQLDESHDGVEQPPQALERREQVRSLVGGIQRLPGNQREALVKRELEGRSHEEIGADLGVSSGAARQLVFRAREALRLGFGSLLPMPLLRWLAEGGGEGAAGVAAGAGGGAIAAKAAVAVFAAGAAVTAGVAIDHGHGDRGRPTAEAAVKPPEPRRRPAVVTPRTTPRSEPIAAPAHGKSDGGRRGHESGGGDNSGPGRGEPEGVDFGSGAGTGPSGDPGPGPRGAHHDESNDSFQQPSDHGDGAGHSGSGRSGGDGRGDFEGSGDHQGSDGHDEGGETSGGSEDNTGSGDSSGGGGEDAVIAGSSPAPSSTSDSGSESSGSEANPLGSDSGDSGGAEGEISSETSRDLSGDAVSQEADGIN